ncbi:MAG: hypothetical protein R3D67_01775 [Hyphomicrobiaceae bacterium]
MIDRYAHMLDWERSVYDTIMLDQAVAAAKSWAGKRGDTLIVVLPITRIPSRSSAPMTTGDPGRT